MSQPKIREGMVVRSRGGEPLGRVIAVDDDGFVLERKVVVMREHRVRLDEVHALDEHGVVLTRERTPPRHLTEEEILEVFWSARRARDEQRPLSERQEPWTGVSQRVVAVTEHAEAYPVQVERGTVRAPRYVPMSETRSRQFLTDEDEESHPPGAHGEPAGAAPHSRPPPSRWSRRARLLRDEVLKHYAARPLTVATSLLDRLLPPWPFSRH
jgi:hypothetical protein